MLLSEIASRFVPAPIPERSIEMIRAVGSDARMACFEPDSVTRAEVGMGFTIKG